MHGVDQFSSPPSGPVRTRLLAALILSIATLSWGMPEMLHAQEEKATPEAAPATDPAADPANPPATPPTTPPAANTPAANPPAPGNAPAANAPPANPAAPNPAPVTEPPESYLSWMVKSSGPFGAMIAIESFVLVALVTMNLLQLRREAFVPAQLVEDFEGLLQKREYQSAYDMARENDSLLGKVLTGGMARISKGYDDAMEGMNEVVEEESMHLEHKLSYIGLIVTTAPMLGLLGTVQGMIESFRVIATNDTAPKPRELADGIATALFTTLEGLIVAIPAVFAYGLFRNQVARLVFEVEQVAESLMSRFASVGKKGGSPPVPPVPNPGPPTPPQA
ncbi:MAG: MotA/TolQ/ExbB proton channel family protein [Planctomycetaceae bacterium]|nr:MotA/TolQ/ExbB proton channel family protein [Planctomycetaceae bacterium]